jgi:hypothetical protein
MQMSFIIQKSMKTNMYLQGRIKIDATLCEWLTNFRNITEQEFGGSFASFVTLLCNSGERDALLLILIIILKLDGRDIQDGPLMSRRAL